MDSARLGLLACLALLLAGCPATTTGFDGGGGGGGGRDGAAADLGPCGACSGATPVCDPKSGQCVACLVDAQCPAATVCKQGHCVPGCTAKHSDCADAGSCDLDGGTCHGCLSDKDCKDANNPFCDPVSGRCGTCSTQNDRCPDGQYCGLANGVVACQPGCKIDAECPFVDGGTPTSVCCAHQCVDVQSAADNCGTCGKSCGAGACCNGACADTMSDPKNCGGCGTACPTKNNTPTCNAGACGVGACVMGYADCDHDPANGCEVPTGSDAKNCGGCGVVCSLANASSLCVAGACAIGACNPGFRDCDANPSNGCEVDITSDPMNCGTCGQSCAKLPHAVAACASGACTVGSCSPNFANCDKVDANGCEVDLTSDINNCGGCAKVCPAPPGVAALCTNGVCSIGGCLPGFADCDGNAANGCEVRLATDPNNCGMCGMHCAALPNAQPACVMGACGLGACNPGFGDCDKNPANGCELSLTSDNNNCGACGNVCQNGQICTNGVCGTPCGNDCWGANGCMTGNGHCIQFTCRAGNAGGNFCNGCKGWKEITYSMWLNQGWCADVIAKYRTVEGTNTHCGSAPSCCGSSGACGGGDNAWHFFDPNSGNNFFVGPCLGCGGNTNCTYWNNVDNSTYTRITACQKF